MSLTHADGQTLSLPFLQSPELTLSQKIKEKLQNPDLLELCHSVPKEVIRLGKAWEARTASPLCFGILCSPRGSCCPFQGLVPCLGNGSLWMQLLLNGPGLLTCQVPVSSEMPMKQAVRGLLTLSRMGKPWPRVGKTPA